ncbi:hypothetical protein [Burkholderia cepacia]|uniref:hypothetical protein n=1 Tax=Burkholderia cepacia TaxID=292 RepID=UPI000752FC8D|nr:hypothetical protein [Burkholderia cepacia]KVH40021.1 hypothetical protein WS88_10010 [Burkholderia cepacia]
MSASARVADAWRRERFTGGFMLLALASGTTIGMAQLATTLHALVPAAGLQAVFSCWLPVVVLVVCASGIAHGRRAASLPVTEKLS